VREDVQEKLKGNAEEMRKQQKSVNPKAWVKGMWVLVKKIGHLKKLEMKFDGPMQILEIETPNLVLAKKDGEEMTVHMDRCKPYFGLPDPEEEADVTSKRKFLDKNIEESDSEEEKLQAERSLKVCKIGGMAESEDSASIESEDLADYNEEKLIEDNDLLKLEEASEMGKIQICTLEWDSDDSFHLFDQPIKISGEEARWKQSEEESSETDENEGKEGNVSEDSFWLFDLENDWQRLTLEEKNEWEAKWQREEEEEREGSELAHLKSKVHQRSWHKNSHPKPGLKHGNLQWLDNKSFPWPNHSLRGPNVRESFWDNQGQWPQPRSRPIHNRTFFQWTNKNDKQLNHVYSEKEKMIFEDLTDDEQPNFNTQPPPIQQQKRQGILMPEFSPEPESVKQQQQSSQDKPPWHRDNVYVEASPSEEDETIIRLPRKEPRKKVKRRPTEEELKRKEIQARVIHSAALQGVVLSSEHALVKAGGVPSKEYRLAMQRQQELKLKEQEKEMELMEVDVSMGDIEILENPTVDIAPKPERKKMDKAGRPDDKPCSSNSMSSATANLTTPEAPSHWPEEMKIFAELLREKVLQKTQQMNEEPKKMTTAGQTQEKKAAEVPKKVDAKKAEEDAKKEEEKKQDSQVASLSGEDMQKYLILLQQQIASASEARTAEIAMKKLLEKPSATPTATIQAPARAAEEPRRITPQLTLAVGKMLEEAQQIPAWPADKPIGWRPGQVKPAHEAILRSSTNGLEPPTTDPADLSWASQGAIMTLQHNYHEKLHEKFEKFHQDRFRSMKPGQRMADRSVRSATATIYEQPVIPPEGLARGRAADNTRASQERADRGHQGHYRRPRNYSISPVRQSGEAEEKVGEKKERKEHKKEHKQRKHRDEEEEGKREDRKRRKHEKEEKEGERKRKHEQQQQQQVPENQKVSTKQPGATEELEQRQPQTMEATLGWMKNLRQAREIIEKLTTENDKLRRRVVESEASKMAAEEELVKTKQNLQQLEERAREAKRHIIFHTNTII
jgi:hypothetical protein